MKRNFIVSFLAVLLIAPSVWAFECPKKIATILGDPLASQSQEIMSAVYRAVGCEVNFLSLPARRGVLYFNSHAVDGELYRLSLIEKVYERDYVRSTYPIMTLVNGLWFSGKTQTTVKKTLGFVRGVKWHEAYIEDLPPSGLTMVEFPSEDSMFAAYNRGAIRYFLSEKQTVEKMNAAGVFHSPPILEETISTLPLYHYLGQEFAPFMTAFSGYIQQHKPFQVME